jgi:hypothetical protein
MDVRAFFGNVLQDGILASFLACSLEELNVIGLRRPTASAGFVWARISAAAFWTGPFQLHITKCLFRH